MELVGVLIHDDVVVQPIRDEAMSLLHLVARTVGARNIYGSISISFEDPARPGLTDL